LFSKKIQKKFKKMLDNSGAIRYSSQKHNTAPWVFHITGGIYNIQKVIIARHLPNLWIFKGRKFTAAYSD